MNFAALFMVAGGCSSAVLALLWFRISQARGWRSARPFAWVAVTASGYCFADTLLVLDVPEWASYLSQHVALALAAGHAMSWIFWFAALDHQRPLFPWERVFARLAAGLIVASLIPGLVVRYELNIYRVDWLNVTYRIPLPTTFGLAVWLFFIGLMWTVAIAAYRRWRAGWRASYPMVSVLVLSVVSVLDILSTAGITNLPLMVDLTFFISITGFGLLYLGRFLEDSARLEQLSTRLEVEVEQRTRELSDTQSALARSEMLAAVGRLASGVAHEINNPAAIVLANLSYLQSEFAQTQRFPSDTREAIGDASEATHRIANIVRQLVEATQGIPGHDLQLAEVAVDSVMSNAVSTVSMRATPGVSISTTPSDLVALADARLLTKVLVQLIDQAAETARARPDGNGCVHVGGVLAQNRVEVRVSDNGPGMSDDARGRLFELFNDSLISGQGTGLGMAVAHGLTRAQGGLLRLVESSDAGSTFAVVLPAVMGAKRTPSSTTQHLRSN
ncbi:MAG: sensor histidine kinase, partial [Gemmatimonadaceae bacterium]